MPGRTPVLKSAGFVDGFFQWLKFFSKDKVKLIRAFAHILTSMCSREYGYAPRGERVIGKISGRYFARTSVVAAKKGKEIIAPFAFRGSMKGDLFEGWLEHIFVPALGNPDKSVLILDNAAFHRKSAIYDIADEYGFKVIFLPPFSPDLNPIEKFWANVIRRLRLHMHNFDSFWHALCHAF